MADLYEPAKSWEEHLVEIAAVAFDMRKAQKAYFKSRSSAHLQRSKELERKLDRLLAERTGNANHV